MSKILIFTGGYLPGVNYGGPITSISNLVEQTEGYLDIYIVTRDRDLKSEEKYPNISPYWNNIGNAKVKYLSEKDINYNNINKIVTEINPDIIYQNSLFDYKFMLNVLFISVFNKYKLLIAPRGELFKNVLNQKRIKKKIYLTLFKKIIQRKNIYFHATNKNEEFRINQVLNVSKNKIYVLQNLPTYFEKRHKTKKKMRMNLSLVFLGRIHPTKNLMYALETLHSIKGSVVYNIYGHIEDESYWHECKKIIADLPSNISVVYKGELKKTDIESTLGKHDFLYLPTLTENFGHVIIEAMMANCPVIISDNTPWNDINEYNAGWAIPLTKKIKHIELINELVQCDDEYYTSILKNSRQYVDEKLNIKNIVNDYLKSFNKIITNEKSD